MEGQNISGAMKDVNAISVRAAEERKVMPAVAKVRTYAGEAFYRTIMEEAWDIVLVVHTNGRIIDANQAAIKAYGYTLQELRNTCIYSLHAPETHASVDEQMKTAYGQGILFRTVHMRKNGERFPVEVSSRRVQFLDGEMLVSIVRDISETIAMETSIREEENKYRKLVQTANVIIMHLNEEGRVIFANEFALRFFGFSPEELLNRSLKDTILPQYESTGRNLWDAFDDMFANPRQYACTVGESVQKNGRRVWIEWANCMTENATGEGWGLITVGIDVTARRRTEISLKINNARRRRNKLFHDLLEDRISEAEFFEAANKEGLCLPAPVVCCVINVDFTDCRLGNLTQDREELQVWLETAADLVSTRCDGTLWQNDQAIVVMRHTTNQASPSFLAWVDNISTAMQDFLRGVRYVIGISTIQQEIRAAYRQASDAASIGPVFHPEKNVFHWRDLGMCRLIFEHVNSAAGHSFVQEWLGVLAKTPSLKNAEMLCTLEEIISGDPINDVAARLHIHPKTVVFRKRKIEQLLSKKLDDPETRLNIAVALKLRKLQQHRKT